MKREGISAIGGVSSDYCLVCSSNEKNLGSRVVRRLIVGKRVA